MSNALKGLGIMAAGALVIGAVAYYGGRCSGCARRKAAMMRALGMEQ